MWLPKTRLPASRFLQLVSMSKRSAALEGRLRETSAREGQLRSALQHTAAGGAAPPAAHAANGARPVSLLPCVLMPLLDTRILPTHSAAGVGGWRPPKRSSFASVRSAGTAQRGEVALASSGPASSAPAAVDLAPDKAQSLSFLVAGALSAPLHGSAQATSSVRCMLQWMTVPQPAWLLRAVTAHATIQSSCGCGVVLWSGACH
jgi:hypothetical protein